ncbi:hypothetical protein JCM5296_000197, partial [Sporobolomyces johnsonii]
MNGYPNPSQHTSVQKLRKLTASKKAERKRENYVDRGIGSIQDGYTTLAQFKSLLASCLGSKTAEGVRDRLGFALGHYGLLRSSNILPVELPDLFSLDLPDE